MQHQYNIQLAHTYPQCTHLPGCTQEPWILWTGSLNSDQLCIIEACPKSLSNQLTVSALYYATI